ncbi:DUF167 domain-containing protein [Falsiroseomonas tokyonensis]|uniref:UPF0235 protein ACFOD3_05400 n=1 Tax=Falsiroseomonas tokyonensis TaxID=430521 RepID=A0ABV7BT46_9PROT|nr:DUF167 domain-containing protein [Falsiroseomonas tokyonensis]MBU8537262.1 DUF167 domain-containing protein [Falsiroseomonas tokyonensis]
MTAWRLRPDGLDLAVKVQPRARRPAFGGLAADGATLKVAVAEAPEDGRANRAVCEAVARALGLPKSAVEVLHGATSRQKTLRITGNPAELSARLEGLTA